MSISFFKYHRGRSRPPKNDEIYLVLDYTKSILRIDPFVLSREVRNP